jgi:glycyl-tRNA synthetase beta subunit
VGAFGDKDTLRMTPKQLMNLAEQIAGHHGSFDWQKARSDLGEFVAGRIAAGWRDVLKTGAADAVARNITRALVGGTKNCIVDEASGSVFELTFAQSFELARALEQVTGEADAPLLRAVASYKRAKNILEKAPDFGVQAGADFPRSQPRLFVAAEEMRLHESVLRLQRSSRDHLGRLAFNELFADLAMLEKPLAEFFESVMVNDPDEKLRHNRLALLASVRDLFETFADFSVV